MLCLEEETREDAFKTRKRNPEESVLRRPQGGQNQVREGTPRFRRALRKVLGRRLEKETEGKTRKGKGGRCPPPNPPP